jgi:hypothetical protein
MKPSTNQFESANESLAAACMACASSCCKKGLLFLLPEEKEQMETWVKLHKPHWLERFVKNLKQEDGFYLFDQEDSCMFLDNKNLCLLHKEGVKPQECFVWPLHVYLGPMGMPEIRVSTTCCEGFKFVSKDSPSVQACEDYALRIGHDRLSRFRELYGGSYGNTLVKELALPPKVRALGPHELHLYRAAGETFFPGEDWDRGMQRISRMHARHGDGLLVYETDGRVLGYATMWPLSDEAVLRLQSGELIDSDIDEKAMPAKPDEPVTNWIMTAIAVNESDKTKRRPIVSGLLYAIFSRLSAGANSQVYAHAATERGRSFLARTGFKFSFPSAETLCVLNILKP